jgi:hypothetical protein
VCGLRGKQGQRRAGLWTRGMDSWPLERLSLRAGASGGNELERAQDSSPTHQSSPSSSCVHEAHSAASYPSKQAAVYAHARC